MNSRVHLPLRVSPQHHQQLVALQRAFSAVCNALAPVVRQHRCWNRVALHHLAYRQMRQRFPNLGSQMICNAIYSVCRSARLVYQHPQSRFNVANWPADKPLPQLQFNDEAPVFFDRHTLSIKAGQVSMYTLDGRMRFDIGLSPADERRFREEKLREIVLASSQGEFSLTFRFGDTDGESADHAKDSTQDSTEAGTDDGALPQYMLVLDADLPPADLQPLEAPATP